MKRMAKPFFFMFYIVVILARFFTQFSTIGLVLCKRFDYDVYRGLRLPALMSHWASELDMLIH